MIPVCRPLVLLLLRDETAIAIQEKISFPKCHYRGSDLTSVTVKGLLTNQMRLIYPINQSDAFDISD